MNFAEDMTLFLIGCFVFLGVFVKRHWRLVLVGFILFLLWRHFIGKVD
jgi:hypothetical protein